MTNRFRIVERKNMIYPMGLTLSGRRLHVSIAAACEQCSLVLYEKGVEEPFQTIDFPQENRMGDVWSMMLEGEDYQKFEYCLLIDGTLQADPYGRMFYGHESWGDLEQVERTLKSPLVIDEFDWEGDRPLGISYEDSIIYRAHVRGLTRHNSSKVKNKGTFQGVQEKIPYFKELGITTLELMPVVEFNEVVVPECVEGNPYGNSQPTGKLNYWGYCSSYYFAPKASFGSGEKKNPVYEFKSLVKALHQAGIEIIVEMYFKGNENPAFVLDAVRFWVREYHLDGIHLVGCVPTVLIGSDPYLKGVKLFATCWDGVKGVSKNGRMKTLGEYNDGFMVDMRRVLKGDEDQMNNLIFRTRRNPRECGIINYIANTNGFTLMDMVSYEMKHNEANGENNQDGNSYNYTWNCGVEGPSRKKKIVELRKKQLRNALLLLFLSQGTPLLLAGDEFGNSKEGNNNSYCQDNEISWLNWNQLKAHKDIYEFVRYIIAFRKVHRVFCMPLEPRAMDYLACGHPDMSYHGVKAWCPEFENFRRQLGIMYCGEYAKKSDGTRDDYFFVTYNMHWEPHEFALPNLPKKMGWYMVINTDSCENNGIYTEDNQVLLKDQKQFTVPPRTVIVFIGKAASPSNESMKS